jgi:hypothetical protein
MDWPLSQEMCLRGCRLGDGNGSHRFIFIFYVLFLLRFSICFLHHLLSFILTLIPSCVRRLWRFHSRQGFAQSDGCRAAQDGRSNTTSDGAGNLRTGIMSVNAFRGLKHNTTYDALSTVFVW